MAAPQLSYVPAPYEQVRIMYVVNDFGVHLFMPVDTKEERE